MSGKRYLEDVIDVCEDAEQRATDECHEKQVMVNEDKAKAIEMRKRAMETIGETRNRTGEESKEEKEGQVIRHFNSFKRQSKTNRSKQMKRGKQEKMKEKKGKKKDLKEERCGRRKIKKEITFLS